MQYNIFKNIIWLFLFFSLTACNGFFEKDNLPPPKPLTSFRPEVTPALLWSTGVGRGVGNDYLKLKPSLDEAAIYTTSTDGIVSAFRKNNGQALWQVSTHIPITTGPGIGCDIVVVGSRVGDVIALDKTAGQILWRKKIIGEILAKPVIADGIVIIKTTNGVLLALSAETGEERWSFEHPEPNFILLGSSTPLIRDHHLIAGFADGSLAKLSLGNGRLQWIETVAIPEGAFAIQRMVDIDADPIMYQHRLYAATYQGKIALLNWRTGNIEWSQDMSSYTGMVADNERVFVSDANSHILALDANSGMTIWEQANLEFRGVTGPASMGPFIVLGDAQGYLHWINKSDGRFAARINAGSPMNAAPLVEDNRLYALTNNGTLIAYTLR